MIDSPWKGRTSTGHEALNKTSDIYSEQTRDGRAKSLIFTNPTDFSGTNPLPV